MACLLQLECNFLHGYFRCRLPVEVVDVEVKITTMQGDTYFQERQNNTTNKMYPMEHVTLCSHPTIVKKMRTFLEVEGKMGLIP